MTMTPLLAPPEAQPDIALTDEPVAATADALGKPFRLSLLGVGAALGLFAHLAAANSYADLDGRPILLSAAATSGLVGLCLILTAAQRDRFGPPMAWITAVTALAWGVLNWISPPFDESVTVWSQPDQTVLSIVGVGNGLLLAGIIALAFVRRGPTLTVAATMLAGVTTLAANTIFLHELWPAVGCLAATFAFMLIAWDRTPRREVAFITPAEPPRVSRAALSFVSVAMCGTALQLSLSRSAIQRSIPAVVLAVLLVGAAFASLIRVRREIERRETTLSEWTSWMREIRKNDFRAEMQNFESSPVGVDGEAPRKLSFPNLSIPDTADSVEPGLAIPSFFDTPHAHDDDQAAPKKDVSTTPDIILPTADPAPADITPTGTTPDIILPTADPAPADITPTGTTPDIILPTADPAPADITPTGTTPDIILPTADPAPTGTTPTGTTPDIILPTADPAPAGTDTPVEDRPAPIAVPRIGVSKGAFSSLLDSADAAPVVAPRVVAESIESHVVEIAGLEALDQWLMSPTAALRNKPLLVAIEAMSLDEYETLPAKDAAMARDEIGSFLAEAMPTADLVSYIDGPYFIVAHASLADRSLLGLNKTIRKALKPTDGTFAFLRPGIDAALDDIVNEAVIGLVLARRNQTAATA